MLPLSLQYLISRGREEAADKPDGEFETARENRVGCQSRRKGNNCLPKSLENTMYVRIGSWKLEDRYEYKYRVMEYSTYSVVSVCIYTVVICTTTRSSSMCPLSVSVRSCLYVPFSPCHCHRHRHVHGHVISFLLLTYVIPYISYIVQYI